MKNLFQSMLSKTGLAVLVVLALGGAEASESTQSSNAPPSTEQPNEDVAKLGDAVTFTTCEWTVLAVKDLGEKLRPSMPHMEAKVSANGKFIAVKYQITNLGKRETEGFMAPRIHDGAEREHRPMSYHELFHTIWRDQTPNLLQKLRPGLPATFVAIYEVPKDTTGIQMEVGEPGTNLDTKRVDLGI